MMNTPIHMVDYARQRGTPQLILSEEEAWWVAAALLSVGFLLGLLLGVMAMVN